MHRFKNVVAYHRAYIENPEKYEAFDVSPGWAAAHMGVSRSRIYYLVEREALDSVKTDDGVILVSSKEVRAFNRAVHQVPLPKRVWAGRIWLKRKRQALSGKLNTVE